MQYSETYFWPHKRISGPALAENFHDVDFTLGRISQTGSGEAKALFIPLSSSKKTKLQSCGGHKINSSCFPIFISVCAERDRAWKIYLFEMAIEKGTAFNWKDGKSYVTLGNLM